jgi:hypothetical protein
MRPNSSIERTSTGRLRLPMAAVHVERYAHIDVREKQVWL